MKFSGYFLSILLLISCGNASISTSSKANAKTTIPETHEFIVSFYSIGTAIDASALALFHAFIKDFETKNNCIINFETSNWGREGETDFCFRLAGWSKKRQTKFIADCKQHLKSAEHIHFRENESCKGR